MAYKRLTAVALLTALMAAGSVQAQTTSGGCRKKCDVSFSSCSKRAKSGDSVCLRTWHKCKAQCTAAAAARPLQTAQAAPAQARGRR